MAQTKDSSIWEMIALEEELHELNERYGIPEKTIWWQRLVDLYYSLKDRYGQPRPVKRKTYLRLCLLSVFGINQFYAGHWIRGLAYLAGSWTGIPVALGFIDWMTAVPKEPDENGMILM